MAKEKRTIDMASEMLSDIPRLNNIKIKGIKIPRWLEKLKFVHILIVWASTITFFGLIYQYFATDMSYLLYNLKNVKVVDLSDSVYFSFITATSTGYGDIVPMGVFKIIAICEIVFGLLLLALVTSKFISLKQDVILSEIYEISFQERINKIRSSLLVFRQNMSRLVYRLDEGKIKRKEMKELYSHMLPLEIAINEVSLIIGKKEENYFTKNIDPLNAEIIFTNFLQSIEKITELIVILNEKHPEWRKDLTLAELENCIESNENLFLKASNSKILPKKTIQNLTEQKNRIIEALRKEINKK